MANFYPKQPEQEQPKVQPFWVTCRQCQQKFSVPAAWVFKYLERIGYHAEQAS